MNEISAELALDSRVELAEGPVWDARSKRLLWVNIMAGEIHVFDPATKKDRVWNVGQPVGVAALRKSGGLVVGIQEGFAFYDLETQKLTKLHDPEPTLPNNRVNDGKVDPSGRFWAGTMPIDGKLPSGALYRLDKDLSVHKMVEGVYVSNGLAWSADAKTMYYIDTRKPIVSAFDYEANTGNLSNRREVVRFDEKHAWPDGMAIDAEGMLWVAHYLGGDVTRSDPKTGKIIGRVIVPNVSNVTSCCFGGANLDELYITTAHPAPEDRAKEPHAGGIFVARPGVRGTPTVEFVG